MLNNNSWKPTLLTIWCRYALAVVVISTFSACQESVPIDVLNAAYVADTIAPELPVRDSMPLKLEPNLILHPSRLHGSALASISAVALDDRVNCVIAVGSALTRTIQLYTTSGAPIATIDGGGPEPGLLTSLDAMIFGPTGKLWVAEQRGGRVSAFAPPHWRPVHRIKISPLPDRLEPWDLWISPQGTIFTLARTAPHTLVIGVPPIRAWTTAGELVGSWGEMKMYPTGPFTAAMSRGSIGGWQDTLVVLEHLTGTLSRFGTSAPASTPHASRLLPRAFATPQPTHGRATLSAGERVRMVPVQYSEHVAELAVDPRGNVFFLQFQAPIVVGEVTKGDRATILGAVTATGDAHLYDLGTRFHAIAASADLLVVAEQSEAMESHQVAVYGNPVPLDAERGRGGSECAK